MKSESKSVLLIMISNEEQRKEKRMSFENIAFAKKDTQKKKIRIVN